MRKGWLAALILHVYIIVSILACLIRFAVSTGQGNMQVHGIKAFQYFTVDSNALMAIVSVITIVWLLCTRKNPASLMPRWLELLTFIAVCSVSVTLVTVCVILGPAVGYQSMFTGYNFIMHLVNPLAAIVLFMFINPCYRVSWKECLLSISTTFIYGVIYFIMVVLIGKENGGWDDFYRFNANGMWYLSFIVMQIMAFLIGMGLRAVHNKMLKKQSHI